MYGSQSTHAWLPYSVHVSYLFFVFSNVYHSVCVWPTALKLGCGTNLDMLFLVMGFISLVDEIQLMLIISCHIAQGLPSLFFFLLDWPTYKNWNRCILFQGLWIIEGQCLPFVGNNYKIPSQGRHYEDTWQWHTCMTVIERPRKIPYFPPGELNTVESLRSKAIITTYENTTASLDFLDNIKYCHIDYIKKPMSIFCSIQWR